MNDIWVIVGIAVFLAFFLGNMTGRTPPPEQRPIVVVPQVTDTRDGGGGIGFAILLIIALFLLLGYFATL